MKNNFSEELEFAKATAYEVGKVQLNHFDEKLRIIRKSQKEFVSHVDIECQQTALQLLGKKFSYKVLSEEQRNIDKLPNNLFWIVDPLDGTHNFISGLPNFGVSIALADQTEFLLGVIYLPFFDQMYYAMKDNGAFMNGKQLYVSDNKDLEKSMVTYDNQFYLSKKSFVRYKKLIENCFTTRILGSAIYDFSLIASAKIDARIWNNTKIFDFAAGVRIVREANGKVTGFNGEEVHLDSREIIASNGLVHDYLIRILNEK